MSADKANAVKFDNDTLACAALVQKGDPDRFRAAMAAPVAARRVLFPLYAFNVEVARAPWVTKEPMIAQMRLQWWRDALGEIAVRGVVRRHEVVTPLATILSPDLAEMLDALVVARHRDIENAMFDDAASLSTYLDHTSGHLTWAAARALGADPACEPVVRDAAWALGLMNYLRAIPTLESAGRQPLPDGRPAAIAALARDGLARLERARRARGKVPVAAMLPLTGVAAGLQRAARRPGDVAMGHLAPGALRQSIETALRAATGRW